MYEPPIGSQLGADFVVRGYQPPRSNEVGVDFRQGDDETPPVDLRQWLFPRGWHLAEYGHPTAFNQSQVLVPHGLGATLWGGAAVVNGGRALRPVAITASAFGRTKVENFTRYARPAGFVAGAVGAHRATQPPALKPLGIAPLAPGRPVISHWLRYVSAGVGASALAWGRPAIENLRRYLPVEGMGAAPMGAAAITYGVRHLLLLGADHMRAGAPAVSLRNRVIAPDGTHRELVGFPLVGGLRYLRPFGFDAVQWGTRIIPPSQTIYGQGFREVWGTPELVNWRTVVKPSGWLTVGEQPADRWGIQYVWNSRQYIEAPFHDIQNNDLAPPPWPVWQRIENRNKVLGVSGFDAARFGWAHPFNNARLLQPQGLIGARPQADLVSHAVRWVPVQSLPSPGFGRWGVVHNAARVVGAKGFVASEFGGGTYALNTRRYYRWVAVGEATEWGVPFIADAVRSLLVPPRAAIAPPRIELPQIKLHTRYIEVQGGEHGRFGHDYVIPHRNILAPRWQLRQFWGTPTVRNATPHLFTRGANSEEFGRGSVRLQWRQVRPDGSNLVLFGRASIADTDRTVQPFGIGAQRISDRVRLSRAGAEPTVTPRIGVYGIPPQIQDGEHHINRQSALVQQPEESLVFGSVRVTSNVIRPPVGFHNYDPVGQHMVSAWVRRIYYSSTPNPDEIPEWMQGVLIPPMGEPRVSPHTIYAVMDAPDQAKRNSPAIATLHYVGGGTEEGVGVSTVGKPEVMHKHRRLLLPGVLHSAAGEPSIRNARNTVTPQGIQMLRMGFPTLPGPRPIELFDSIVGSALGWPAISRPPYVGPQTIIGQCFVASQWGLALAEPLHRPIYPQGTEMTRMGTRLEGDRPYMWQGLRVGPHVPMVLQGPDTSLFGQQWVSFRVRGVEPEGFDAFSSEYDLANWQGRMRVWRRNMNPGPARQTLRPHGLPPVSVVGAPGARLKAHYIRPDGNAETFRQGVPHE